MLDLSRFLDRHPEPAALVGPDGQTVPLPLEAFRILASVAEAMREGKAITIAPIDQVLTTQEAADFLAISRPALVKLLGPSQSHGVMGFGTYADRRGQRSDPGRP